MKRKTLDDHKRRDLDLLPHHRLPKNHKIPGKPILALLGFIIGFGIFIILDLATS